MVGMGFCCLTTHPAPNEEALLAHLDTQGSKDRLWKCRYAAQTANHTRFNRLSLLQNTDTELYDTVMNFDEMTMSNVRARILGIVIIVALVPFASAWTTCTDDMNCWGMADPKMGISVGFVLVFGSLFMSWLAQTIIGRCLMTTPEEAGDRPVIFKARNYKRVFSLYYWFFKFWQVNVILAYAPGLVYKNINLFPASRALSHAGMFVVGLAVNIVQITIIFFGVLALMADNAALVTVIGVTTVRATLFLFNLVLSPSDDVMSLIDKGISDSPLNPVFSRMRTRSSFVLTEQELEDIQNVRPTTLGVNQQRQLTEWLAWKTVPSSTHTLTFLLQTHDGALLRMHLDTGVAVEM